MKALEELTADIREKLPRLKELEAGCKFTRKDEFGIIWENIILQVGGGGQIADTGDYHDACYEVYSNRDGIETFADLDREIENVIGKDPMLNDVLEWINDDSISVYCDGCFCHAENGLYYLEDGNDIIRWDMSSPNLKDQSPKLIEFLHGLINH